MENKTSLEEVINDKDISIEVRVPNFKKVLRWVKEHLSLLVLLPALMGGIWQMLVLSQFGLSYVRFFSISQLISDGLIILLFIPLIILSTYLIIKASKINPANFPKLEILVTLIITLINILIFYHFITSYGRFKSKEPENILFEFLLAAFSLYITLIGASLSETYGKNHRVNWNIIRNKSIKKIYLYKKEVFISLYNYLALTITIITVISSFLLYILVTINTIFSIGDYDIPENLYNIKTVNQVIEKNFNINNEDFEISYHNDTYIFVRHFQLPKKERDSLTELKQISPSEIIILKSDVFFKELKE